jgi:hypothetical protein
VNQGNSEGRDDIPLRDIFAVLLQYKRIISVTIFGSLFVAVAGYFIYLPYRYTVQGVRISENVYEARMTVTPTQAGNSLLSGRQIGLYYCRPDVMFAALRHLADASGGFPDTDEAMLWVPVSSMGYSQNGNEKVYGSANNRLVIKETADPKSVEFLIRWNEPEQGVSFLKEVLALGNAELEKHVRFSAEIYVNLYEKAIRVGGLTESKSDGDLMNYWIAREFLSGNIRLMDQIIEPYAYVTESIQAVSLDDVKQRYIVNAAIVIFCVFFLVVFLIFLINAMKDIAVKKGTAAEKHENPHGE